MNCSNNTISIHREGFKFIGISFLVSLIFIPFCLSCFFIFFICSFLLALFFRNPKRVVPDDKNLIVSTADGIVCNISQEVPPSELEIGDEKRYKISIFLSIFNVHVNRTPMAGKIKKIIYTPGQFLNASLDKSSIFNERNTIVMDIENNQTIAYTQIAGTVARRIVCDVHEGEKVNKGAAFGLICFGSRNDIWLPVGTIPQVYIGQSVIAGETVLCDLSQSQTEPRTGTVVS